MFVCVCVRTCARTRVYVCMSECVFFIVNGVTRAEIYNCKSRKV